MPLPNMLKNHMNADVLWYANNNIILHKKHITISVHHITHWGWVTHKCVSNLTITGSDNGLSPGRRQAIIWTNAGILLIGPLGTNLSEILIENKTFSFKKMRLKMSSAKWRPSGFGLNVIINAYRHIYIRSGSHAGYLAYYLLCFLLQTIFLVFTDDFMRTKNVRTWQKRSKNMDHTCFLITIII